MRQLETDRRGEFSKMMSTITLHQVPIRAKIGAYDWEQAILQTVLLDLELSYDSAKAASSDQLIDALDYAKLIESLREFIQASPCRLIETLAKKLQTFLLENYPIQSLKFTLTKPHAIPNAGGVSITLSY